MSEKILIIDDEPETLHLITLMLERQGFQVLAVDSGQQALVAAAKEQPDLILLDIMMPDLDGYQVTRKIRHNPATQSIPVLMFTAKSQVADKVAGYEAGADDYLTKPIHPAELGARIKALLARRKTHSDISTGEGRTIGVCSANGGAGVSTVALNLAIALGRKTQLKTIAAELRPGQGTWSLELGYKVSQGLNNLLKMKTPEINHAAVEHELIRTESGTLLLLASNRTADVDLAGATRQLGTVLNELPRIANFVLLDIGTGFNPCFENILYSCHELILVFEPNPTSIQRTHLFIEELEQLGFGKTRRLTIVMVNRVRADVQITINQVKEFLGSNVNLVLPPVPEQAYNAALRFIPLINVQPEGVITQQFLKLAEIISEHAGK